MAFLFRKKRLAPPVEPTDMVVPLHVFDDNSINRAINLNLTLRFDDVLDPTRLHGALVRLLELGDWRKLGARLRQNKSGALEYHIPARYDEKRPSVAFSHISFEMDIGDHEMARQMPRASSQPAVHPDPASFDSLTHRPDVPRSIEDHIFGDEPQLSLHIVSFNDATLVSLSWSHTLLDGMGRAQLLHAWASVLNGREDEVPPFLGFSQDLLKPLGNQAKGNHLLADRKLSGIAFVLFVLRLFFEVIWWRKQESHVINLPDSSLQAMKRAGLSELAEQDGSDEKQFLSDGDVLCGWASRLVMQDLVAPTSTKTVMINNAFGLRSLLAGSLLPAGGAYISNASSMVFAPIPANMLFRKTLGPVAWQVRCSVQQQGTREQQENLTAMFRKNPSIPPLFGEWNSQMLIFSNWTKARFFETDFSTAVIGKPGIPLESRSNALGRPSYVQVHNFPSPIPDRYAFPIYGKDAAGNHWIMMKLRASTWRSIERNIHNLS